MAIIPCNQLSNPCTDSKCGRMTHIYPEQNLRAYPGTIRDIDEWESTYKTSYEKSRLN